MAYDPYDDFTDDTPLSQARLRAYRKKQRKDIAKSDVLNEVGEVEPLSPENLSARTKYERDYVSAHQEIFTRSTGIKPFGSSQIESIKRTQNVLKEGGRSIVIEPRGFGKTSRTANNALLATLQGLVKYILILASSVEKAQDILDSIKTELIDNEKLAEIYPEVCACFDHIGDNYMRTRAQTYMGEKTFIATSKQLMRFPYIEGSPSSGSIIQVRSKDNVRGLAVKVRYGPEAGTVMRPQFVILDDIQTDEEAESPTSVYKIIQVIKKSVLFAGTHARPISAMMTATPIVPGDVPSHFVLNEPSWDCVVSKMVEDMPENLDLWLNEYASILMDFDRYTTGSRIRARLRARKYVEDNYEALHKGARVSWEWAYAWGEQPQTEVSALQHAMNFLIENGTEAFESECQCNVQARIEETTGVKSTIDEIMGKTHPFGRRRCPVDTKYIVTHVDVNKGLLTYVTLASAKDFRPMVIDYGEAPEQKGAIWRKRDLVYTYQREYKEIPEHHEALYQCLKDLLNSLHNRMYAREDGLEMTHNLILVDMGYMIDEVQRAIRDSLARPIACCYRGQGIRARDKPFMDRHYQKHATKHFHCATVPTTDRTLTVLYADSNFFKTHFHKGIKSRPGLGGSISLFEPERTSTHLLFAKHSVVEIPEEDFFEKEKRTVITWSNPQDQDNEYFDNVTGAMAGLFKCGCEIRAKHHKKGTYSIQDYVS